MPKRPQKKEKGVASKKDYSKLVPTKAQAKKVLLEIARGVSEADIKKVLDASSEIRKKFEVGGPLGRFIEDVKLLISLVKDYFNGNYREIPFASIAAIVAALIYVISPIDLIPDFIPVIGLSDDAAVVAVCLALIEYDLHRYKEWTIENAA